MRKSFVGLLVGVFLFSFAPKASADLFLAGDLGGLPGFCASDNDVLGVCAYGQWLPDNDPTVGILDIGTATVGGLTVSASLHQSTFGPPTNVLESSSLLINNPTGAAVQVDAVVSATDFVGPSTEAFTTGSGTWANGSQGSSTTFTWYNDPTNTQGGLFGTDHPGILVDSFSDTSDAFIDSFSHNGGPFAVGDIGPLYSMTLGFSLNLLGGDGLRSRGQAETADVTAVPEPMSMLLLGSGLLGGGGYLKRRQRKA